MRRVRLAYLGSYHHVMNRGINGMRIFRTKRCKKLFLQLFTAKARVLKIKLLAYCIMDSHYHIVLQNTSGKLSEYLKQVNGQYGMYYRKLHGGKGYVFQNRFKSLLIQNDRYLRMVLIYVLLNPTRAGKVAEPQEYLWSSIHEYFTGKSSGILHNDYLESLFETKELLYHELRTWGEKYLPTSKTRYGEILGDDEFVIKAVQKFDRRSSQNQSLRMRQEECGFKKPENVIEAFEQTYTTSINKIDCQRLEGKRLRAQLLVALKDEAGMTYSEIIQLPIFQAVKYSSLGQIYRRAKQWPDKRCR
jgi:hypothetical protein